MRTDDRRGKARIEFELQWRSDLAAHRERFLAPSVSLWRDIIDRRVLEALGEMEPGAEGFVEFAPGEAVPRYGAEGVLTVPESKVRLPAGLCGDRLRLGRFYPRGILSSAPGGPFPQDLRPFRVIALERGWVFADCNHPLALRPLRLRVRVVETWEKTTEIGGSCLDLVEEVTGGGPGMQGRWKRSPTDFGSPGAFSRQDVSEDRLFYSGPRLVGHVDAAAGAFLEKEFGRRVPEGARVLDLMSSVESHLPSGAGMEVVGLGLNGEELAANGRLSERVVQDLNGDPRLPFADGEFGSVVCSLSWEYLVRPDEVLAEAARVIAPGGVLLVGLSDRWFPPKVIRIWTLLQEFERVGMVLEQVSGSGFFEALETLSVRNWPRPPTDRHWPDRRVSDPVHVVAARRLR